MTTQSCVSKLLKNKDSGLIFFRKDFSPFKKYHKGLHNISDESESDTEKIFHSLFSENNSQESMDKRLILDV